MKARIMKPLSADCLDNVPIGMLDTQVYLSKVNVGSYPGPILQVPIVVIGCVCCPQYLPEIMQMQKHWE